MLSQITRTFVEELTLFCNSKVSSCQRRLLSWYLTNYCCPQRLCWCFLVNRCHGSELLLPLSKIAVVCGCHVCTLQKSQNWFIFCLLCLFFLYSTRWSVLLSWFSWRGLPLRTLFPVQIVPLTMLCPFTLWMHIMCLFKLLWSISERYVLLSLFDRMFSLRATETKNKNNLNQKKPSTTQTTY